MTVPPLRASTFQDTRPIEKYGQGPYSPESYALIVSIRQRSYLRRLVRASFTDRRPVQHDYGCGTGRALRLLQGMVREAHGYDSSYEVIEAARESGLRARLHEIPSGDPAPAPVPADPPSIVTVFRPLRYTPGESRGHAVEFAARVLPSYDSGLLVLEQQRGYRLRRSREQADPWLAYPSAAQVAAVLRRYGFTVVARHACAMLPIGAYRSRLLRPLVYRLDGLLCRLEALSRFAVVALYVARRNPPSTKPHHSVRA